MRIWKIRHSSPGCSFVWILRVVYFPLKHSCLYYKACYGLYIQQSFSSQKTSKIAAILDFTQNLNLLKMCGNWNFFILVLQDIIWLSTLVAFYIFHQKRRKTRSFIWKRLGLMLLMTWYLVTITTFSHQMSQEGVSGFTNSWWWRWPLIKKMVLKNTAKKTYGFDCITFRLSCTLKGELRDWKPQAKLPVIRNGFIHLIH